MAFVVRGEDQARLEVLGLYLVEVVEIDLNSLRLWIRQCRDAPKIGVSKMAETKYPDLSRQNFDLWSLCARVSVRQIGAPEGKACGSPRSSDVQFRERKKDLRESKRTCQDASQGTVRPLRKPVRVCGGPDLSNPAIEGDAQRAGLRRHVTKQKDLPGNLRVIRKSQILQPDKFGQRFGERWLGSEA